MGYKRRNAEKAIVYALRDLGGTAPRKEIRKTIAENEYDNFKYEDVYFTKVSAKTGKSYSPFLYDFNFGIKSLLIIGYINPLERGKDISLTISGRNESLSDFPSEEQKQLIKSYWDKKAEERVNRISSQECSAESDDDENSDIDDPDSQQDADESEWKTDLLNCLMKFSPTKFESFSRALISKMGVTIDKKRGIISSRDHGIDGFGYFKSDEFRTSRVAIQCKRYTKGRVSEPDIDKFKGVMDGFNAEYGIFITTSNFTQGAKEKATQGNNTVTLIDGQELASLVEKYELHISPIKTYSLDSYYYEKD